MMSARISGRQLLSGLRHFREDINFRSFIPPNQCLLLYSLCLRTTCPGTHTFGCLERQLLHDRYCPSGGDTCSARVTGSKGADSRHHILRRGAREIRRQGDSHLVRRELSASNRPHARRSCQVDHLVNNAGSVHIGAIEEVALSEGIRQFDANFFGLVSTTNLFLPHLGSLRSAVGITGRGIY